MGLGLCLAPYAYAADATVVFPTAPESIVWQAPEQVCEEIIYTYAIEVSGTAGDTTVSDFTFVITDEDDEMVAEVTNPNAIALTPAESFATNVVAVEVPCMGALSHELYSDDFTVSAGETENFTFKVFFTPEFAGSFRSVLTGIVFGTDSAQEKRANGGSGRCLNCDSFEGEVLGESDAFPFTVADIETMIREAGITDPELLDVFAMIKLLIEKGII
jgi:hypothetical protein